MDLLLNKRPQLLQYPACMFSSHQTLLVYIVLRTPATQTQQFPCTSTAHPSPSARDSRRGQDRRTIVKSPSTREMGRRCFHVTNITLECVLWCVISSQFPLPYRVQSYTCPSYAVQLLLYAACFVSQHFCNWTSVVLQILIII